MSGSSWEMSGSSWEMSGSSWEMSQGAAGSCQEQLGDVREQLGDVKGSWEMSGSSWEMSRVAGRRQGVAGRCQREAGLGSRPHQGVMRPGVIALSAMSVPPRFSSPMSTASSRQVSSSSRSKAPVPMRHIWMGGGEKAGKGGGLYGWQGGTGPTWPSIMDGQSWADNQSDMQAATARQALSPTWPS